MTDSLNENDAETGDKAEPVRKVSSTDLLEGTRELIIEHEGECYRLRHTSKGKLILTK